MDKRIIRVKLNKNRGWRGLAELICENGAGEIVYKMVFSFSSKVWEDLMGRCAIVIQDDYSYYVIHINTEDILDLPREQQRSVLIKNWTGKIEQVIEVNKTDFEPGKVDLFDYIVITNFKKNNNKHTTSNWNYIGLRVIPEI